MKIGFLINPMAGIGGPAALKGSDGEAIVREALARGAKPQAGRRAATAMQALSPGDYTIVTAAGDMGEAVLQQLNLPCEVIYQPSRHSSAEDTKNAVRLFIEQGADLIMFAGGDGTARDVLDVLSTELNSRVPVIGIPAGVKIHSAVYALTPAHAGELLAQVLAGAPLLLQEARVMDLDEEAFRAGRVQASCYGYLNIPQDDSHMQLSKESSRQGAAEDVEAVLQDIAADIIETMQEDVYYLIGSGSTTAAVMQQLGLENTLLGVDIVCNEALIASDVSADDILQLTEDRPVELVVTVIGGQGHVFGRGNQQLSPRLIRRILAQPGGKQNIRIIATPDKLRTLQRRAMIADTGDVELDRQLAGLYPVLTGYQQHNLYRLQ